VSACESEWGGHSEQTALQHYRRATPLDHEQAIKSDPKKYPQRADFKTGSQRSSSPVKKLIDQQKKGGVRMIRIAA
jgi:hypothetical protein